MSNYKIVELKNHVITLDVDGSQMNFPLPLVDGKYPVGEALVTLLNAYSSSFTAPSSVPDVAENDIHVRALIDPVLNKDYRSNSYRVMRDKLLARTDCTQTGDFAFKGTETKEAWAEYRAQLRNVTEQSGYPFTIVWPVPPSIVKTTLGYPMTDELGNPVNLG